jgi:cytochrome P450
VWHVRGFAEARAVMRSDATRQAGFGAEMIEKLPTYMNPPILYLEGEPHHEQRRQTARFFTPRTTERSYREFMEQYAETVIAELEEKGQADLGDLSMKMAVQVASQVVGLTDSRLPGMEKRIDIFLQQEMGDFAWNWGQIAQFLRNQWNLTLFFFLDVQPAIKARRQERREDVISHLLDSGYSDTEILTECITYGAAGMVTTREFIGVVVWHCLENPAYRDLLLSADQDERYRFLHELLRLEPVVGRLYRRATAPLTLESGGETHTIPEGALIDVHTYAVNADERVVGERPLHACPNRQMAEMRPRAPEFMMSFGDGSHRCPGAFIAIQETDIFVRKLLAIDSLHVAAAPDLTYNQTVQGYELHDFIIGV